MSVVLCAAGCANAGPQRHEIAIRGFVYEPARLQVAVGDTVVWSNHDLVPHNASAQDSLWDSGTIANGARGLVVASGAGVQTYVCAFHPNMVAVLSVRTK